MNLGYYDNDSPEDLIELMIDEMSYTYFGSKEENGKQLDAIFISGDFVFHGLASKNPSVNNWDKMVPIFQLIIAKIKAKFPNTPILPSVGNNDVIWHYQAPSLAMKA